MQLLKYYSAADLQNGADDAPIFTDDPGFREHLEQRQQQRRHSPKPGILLGTGKAKPKKSGPRRRAKTTPEIKWLKDLICPFVYGDKTPDGPMPSVKKDAFIGRWNMRLPQYSLPNYKLLDHFQGRETLYFMGRGGEKTERTLVLIDIDVLKAKMLGTPQGARKFAEHLKTIWPDLYFEPSTNGNGVHGYFILWKRGSDAKTTNSALKRLEAWLRAEAEKTKADIEQVEIKGTGGEIRVDGEAAP